ncbi:MAG: GspE/PulE family protein [bacterium]|nr:GspE/PulE family protein [bacterium]
MENALELKTQIAEQVAKEHAEVSVIKLVDLIVRHAYAARASDIHIDPAETRVFVRERIDGILHDDVELPKGIHSEVITRIKVLSGLKTDIHHVPQDGRFRVHVPAETKGAKDRPVVGESDIDIRVSIAPTYYGENCVMRILAASDKSVGLAQLGFNPLQLEQLDYAIKKPYGMLLTNGPTGSGKTTTLYTMIKLLNTRDASIVTIEDPIEYSIEGITQMPVNVSAGFTFASGLRSILRQDPNIIMVGEIRDDETASIAVNAALTGHLVLSTLHTNDAATTFPRLTDMGAPPFLLASTVNIVVAQRLVRVVCPSCRIKKKLNLAELKSIAPLAKSLLIDKVYTAGPGCEQCDQKSYKGRIGIYEVLDVNEEIRPLIVGRADAAQIRTVAVKHGMKTMIEDGLMKAQEGVTTIEEVLRIVYE